MTKTEEHTHVYTEVYVGGRHGQEHVWQCVGPNGCGDGYIVAPWNTTSKKPSSSSLSQ